MYKIEIPKETKIDIIVSLSALRTMIYTPINEKKFLLEAYYRYVEPLRGHETVEKKVKAGLRCAYCFANVKAYFTNNERLYKDELKSND
jgi:hypothetical protein